MKIVADSHIPFIDEYFASSGEVTKVLGREISAADVADADLLFVRSVTGVNKELLENSSVKFVGSMTAGIDHIDVDWLNEKGIKWCATQGFNAPPVADYVVTILAALMQRHLLPQKRYKVAVVGVGNVGKLVVERLKLLNLDVVICDPLRARDEDGFESTDLAEIQDVDVVLLHVPLTKDGDYPTYHMIDEEFIRRQKNGCVLVNVSRGAVIDTNALLEHGSHLLTCLDVFEGEPVINKKLLEFAKFTTPHIAGYSKQSKLRGVQMLYQAAREAGVIDSLEEPAVEMPYQELQYSGKQYCWQDIVLGIFNPVLMTAMMREKILPAEHHDVVFDELRNRFTYRHEFAFTRIPGLVLPPEDTRVIAHLGFDISSK